VRIRLAVLWSIPVALVALGFAVAWVSAVATAERYAQFAAGPMVEPDVDWAAIAGTSASPLLLAGFVSLVVVLAVHGLLWRARVD